MTRVEVSQLIFRPSGPELDIFVRPDLRCLCFDNFSLMKDISTKFDRRNTFEPRKNYFDCIRMLDFSRPRSLSTKKVISNLFHLGKMFQLSLIPVFLRSISLFLNVETLLQLCATHVATNVLRASFCDLCGPCCDFARPILQLFSFRLRTKVNQYLCSRRCFFFGKKLKF